MNLADSFDLQEQGAIFLSCLEASIKDQGPEKEDDLLQAGVS